MVISVYNLTGSTCHPRRVTDLRQPATLDKVTHMPAGRDAAPRSFGRLGTKVCACSGQADGGRIPPVKLNANGGLTGLRWD